MLRVALAAAIVVALLTYSGARSVWSQFAQADGAMLTLAGALMLLETLCRVQTWRNLLKVVGVAGPASGGLWRCYLASSFAGALIPSSAGTDVLRALFAWRQFGGRLASYAASLILLNATTFLAGSALALLAIALLGVRSQVPAQLLSFSIALVAIVVVLPTAYVTLRRRRGLVILGLRQTLRRRYRTRHALRRFFAALLVVSGRPVQLAQCLGNAGVVMLVNAASLGVVGGSLGIVVSPEIWLLLPPLLAVAGLLPLSVLGFGAHQAAMVAALALFGIPVAKALTLGIVNSLMWMVVIVVAGGIAFIKRADQPESSL
jgi:glycosyltransferase 2 family protein